MDKFRGRNPQGTIPCGSSSRSRPEDGSALQVPALQYAKRGAWWEDVLSPISRNPGQTGQVEVIAIASHSSAQWANQSRSTVDSSSSGVPWLLIWMVALLRFSNIGI